VLFGFERNSQTFKEKSKPCARVLDGILLEAEAWKLVGFL
jgi:hypothetical protein